MATTRKAVPMCVVTVDFQDYLMPVTSGMKLVELMSKAVKVEARGYPTEVSMLDQPDVRMEMVKPSQIRQPRPKTAPLGDDSLLENKPSPVLHLR